MSATQRIDYVVVDELGMDPLRDRSFDAVYSVNNYQYYTVDSMTEANAALISDICYNTTDLWWAILAYNKIADNFQLKTGMRIMIPNVNELTSALAKLNNVQKTTRI